MFSKFGHVRPPDKKALIRGMQFGHLRPNCDSLH